MRLTMEMFILRLNPDTRTNCLSYSKYPTADEYQQIHNNSPMDGFHEAVNFLSENGTVRGYLPPKHSALMKKSMMNNESFILITITAKTAKIKPDQIVGIQIGCRYCGEHVRQSNNTSIDSPKLTWHYECPASLSMLFGKPIPNARRIILGKDYSWIRNPTLHIKNKKHRNAILDKILAEQKNSDYRNRFENLIGIARDDSQKFVNQVDIDLEFDSCVVEALSSNNTRIKGNKNPIQREARVFIYERDPSVVAYALKEANGICYDCKNEGPFISKLTGMPYLEVHHIKMLKDGGSDTPNNVIALCPNCHRKRHFCI